MQNKILSGKLVSQNITQNLALDIEKLKSSNITPKLAAILIGENPGDQQTVTKPLDINQDGVINITDVIGLVNMIINNEYSDIADVNNSESLNITDVIALVNTIIE